jgi:hypothetical protein
MDEATPEGVAVAHGAVDNICRCRVRRWVGSRAFAGRPAVLHSRHGCDALMARAASAAEMRHFGLVALVCASCGAAARGVAIPGNAVLMAYRNDLVGGMLRAGVAVRVEASLSILLTEGAEGTATASYRRPGDVFSLYGSPVLDGLAGELDALFQLLAADAVGA